MARRSPVVGSSRTHRGPSLPDPIRRSTLAAASAWRRSQMVAGAMRGAAWALLGIAIAALVLEFRGGLRLDHLLPLCAFLLLVPVFAIVRRPALAAAASELDRRAGLADRLGTALEFAGSSRPLAPGQAADAAAHAPVRGIAALFPLPWRAGRPALAALLLALLAVGAGLAFELRPADRIAPIEDLDDALAEIERQQEHHEAEGDKEAVRLLSDLDRTLRRIRENERTLRRALKTKRAPQPDEPDEDPEELAPQPTPAPSKRITAADLERLEADTIEQLDLSDEQQRAIVSELFQHSQQAKELVHEFHELSHGEYDVTQNAINRNRHNESRPGQNVANELKASDAFANNNIAREQAMNNDDVGRENEDMIRRDLSEESQAAHDKAHDAAESFNQFLGDFVKDVQELVAEAATGKKEQGKPGKKGKKGKEVQVDPGAGAEDKTDAMAETGFESMDDVKRHRDAAPPEQLAGEGPPPEGPPPDGLEATSGSGPVDGPAVQGEGDGTTSAGASGAGSAAESEGGLKTMLQGLSADQDARLEETLGQMREGALSDEAREAMFDRVVRHKVQAGLASERDDVLVDYFADAEELMLQNAESLPPLFRDYAQSYFDAIRPGGGS